MSEQREVVILSGVRTAIGDYGGSLKDMPPTELAAQRRQGGAQPREGRSRTTSASACSAT